MSQPTIAVETRLQAAIADEEIRALRLGAFGRFICMVLIAIWLGIVVPLSEAPYFWGVLAAFAIAGWLPYDHRRRGKAWRWPRYVYPLVDAVLMGFTILAPNPLDVVPYPPQLNLRFGYEAYFTLLIASTVFYYSPRVVVWAGFCASLVWSAGTLWVVSLPDTQLFSNDTLHQIPVLEDEIAYILRPDLVNLNTLGSSCLVFMLVAGTLAGAVSRFRRLLFSHATAERERSNLARHFSPNMVEELSHMDEPLGDARSQNVAVLFADIVGFTRLAEAQPPEKILALLRETLGLMSKQVFAHEGTLDKYLGDGIMATFGTPHGNGHEAEDALACARGILAEITALNERREARGEQPVKVGIGLHFGPVVLGDVGDESRLEYAVIGDTVNVASRFERLTRDLGVQLVVSGDLVSALGGRADTLINGLKHGDLQRVRGREEPVPVWTL